jgi:hypothetical protein
LRTRAVRCRRRADPRPPEAERLFAELTNQRLSSVVTTTMSASVTV